MMGLKETPDAMKDELHLGILYMYIYIYIINRKDVLNNAHYCYNIVYMYVYICITFMSIRRYENTKKLKFRMDRS